MDSGKQIGSKFIICPRDQNYNQLKKKNPQRNLNTDLQKRDVVTMHAQDQDQ